ncbi:MAG: hypothetical protein ACXQS2_06130 [Methermicoccaceae archaeon]
MPDLCSKEVEIELLKSEIGHLREDQAENLALTKEIFRVLQGNGNVGLVTQVALSESAIKRIWWWLGTISAAMMGAALGFFFRQ